MRDMTKGAPLGHLFFYAVPLLLGNWLQLAYNAVDSIIAGRFIGQDALAAEGIAGPVMNLVILAVSGLCIGAGVLMSEAFGAKNEERLKETMATALLFGAALCCAVALLGVAAAPLILHSLAVPDEILHSTGIYLRITLPLIVPALITAGIFSFMWRWDDFLSALLYVKESVRYPASLALKLFCDPGSSSDYGAMFAMSTLSIIPAVTIFIVFQKYLVEGIATSGLKG